MKKSLITLILFSLIMQNCYAFNFRRRVKDVPNLNLNNNYVSADLHIEKYYKYKNKINKKEYYVFCGIFEYMFKDKFFGNKAFYINYQDTNYKIYPDSIAASDIMFYWDGFNVALYDNKQIKACVDFDIKDIDWKDVELVFNIY